MEWIKGSITPDLGAFVTQMISTIILVIILKAFLWKPIKEFADKRREYIKSQYDDAERLKHETEKFVLEAETKKNNIYNQSSEIIMAAKKEGESIKSKAIEDSKFETSRRLQRANDEIEDAKVKAKKEVIEVSSEFASIIAEKLVKSSVSKEDQSALISEALNEIR